MLPAVSIPALHRALIVLATLVCLLFASTLLDTPAFTLVQELLPPPVPASVGDRDGRLTVEVHDADGKPVAGARVLVLLMRNQIAYLAGNKQTDRLGRIPFEQLPRGEIWVLANAENYARASGHLVLSADPGELKLVTRPAARLSVIVSSDEGKPVPRPRIEVRCADPLPFIAIGGQDGHAEIGRLCPPPYELRVSADGFEPAKKSSVTPGAVPLRVTLRQLGSIAVSVVTSDDEPAPLSTVYLVGPGVWPARQTKANAFGRCTIAGLPAGSYDLRAERVELVSPTATGVAVERGAQAQVHLILEQGRRLAIQVVDGDGPDAKGVPGASVVLAEGGLSSFPLEGRTDKEGRITLGPVSNGPLTISARADGFVPNPALAVPSDTTSVRVPLVRGGRLVGDVVDGRGFSVSGASVEVVGTDPNGMPIDESPNLQSFRAAHFTWALQGPPPLIPAGELGVMPGPIPPIPHGGAPSMPSPALKPGSDTQALPDAWVSDRNGNFTAGPIPPGRVRAIVRHPAYVEGTSDMVSLAPGGEAHVHVVLQSGGTLEGRVVDDRGFPVANARVQVTAQNGSSERSTLTSDDGTFTFTPVSRDLSIVVSRPSSPDDVAWQGKVAVGADEKKKIEIVLRAERDPIEVHVNDDRGYPIDTAQVVAMSLTKESSLRSTGFTAKDGKVKIADACGIAVRIEASSPGYATSVKVVQDAPNQLTITLMPGIKVRGKVTGRSGRDRLEDASVTAYLETGARHLLTNRDGEYAINDLAPGQIRIRVDARDHVAVEKTFQVTEPSIRDRGVELDPINLEDAGTVEGEVVDERGEPVVGARVAKDAVPAWLPVGPLPPGVVATNAKGEFLLGGLPEGNVLLEALLPDVGRGKVRDVQVIALRTTRRVRITLSKTQDARSTDAPAGLLISLRDAGGGSGVVIRHVSSGSTAERAGLTPGDVIVRIDGVIPSSVGDAQRRLAGPERQDVLLDVQKGRVTITLRVPRERIRQ